ncbi:TPA: hypothetical protein SIA35_004249 [Aeromonas sobria]|nr:hypothetical protein [Aeromonas sobria]
MLFSRHTISTVFLSIISTWGPSALADSSSPRLAAYYDNFLAICGKSVYEWQGFDSPQKSFSNIKQVGVGNKIRYALTNEKSLIFWRDNSKNKSVLMEGVEKFYAGESGVFAIRNDNSLWYIETDEVFFGKRSHKNASLVASNVTTASIGDSANYYVTSDGALFVQGLAHRGQYGDGKLTSTENYIQTAEDVYQVVAHTGHALLLKHDGSVWGTGGNIYGPLGHHGYGDKAIQWGIVLEGVRAIATGSSHSLAIKRDGSLLIWGQNEGLKPKEIMSDVVAVAAGSRSSIAISQNALWQWNTGSQPAKIMTCE